MGLYYYVTRHPMQHNQHVVHAAGCTRLPLREDRQFLGTFYAPAAAVLQAEKYFSAVVRCELCCAGSGKKKRQTADNAQRLAGKLCTSLLTSVASFVIS